MCLICHDFSPGPDWVDGAATTGHHESQARASERRITLLNALLARYGLSVTELGPAGRMSLHDRKGRTEMLTGLPTVWRVAQEMSHRLMDPLDRALLWELEQ